MSSEVNLLFLNCKMLGQPGSLESLLDCAKDMGFELWKLRVGSYVEGPFGYWKEYNQRTRHELPIAYEKRHLAFGGVDQHSQLILTFDTNWELSDTGKSEHGRVNIVSFETEMFTQERLDPEYHTQRFLELGETLYNVVRPVFGWIERCPLSGYTASEDVEKLEVPHLYWANFFGPEYVKKLGREYLLNAPGWKKEALEDGGFLYVLSSSLSGTGPRAVVEEVKRYFGVESVRRRQK